MESIDCGRSITETKRGVEGSIMKTLVKNGMIVSPEDTYEADVLIEDGVMYRKKPGSKIWGCR